MNHLKEVRAAIVKACPEIMELKFGCEIFVPYASEKHRARIVGQKNQGRDAQSWGSWVLEFLDYAHPRYTFNQVLTITKREMTEIISKDGIIGRSIRLADVLRAMTLKLKGTPDHDLLISGLILENTATLGCTWNLAADNLDDQSQECIDFLFDTLCV